MKIRAPILAGVALALALGGAIGASSALILTTQPAVAVVAAAAPIELGTLENTPDIPPPSRRPSPPTADVWPAASIAPLPGGVIAPIE